jgi:protein tyrosine phosphatase
MANSLEGSISIDEIIMMLRKYRNNMVGHSDQYVFCHKAPLELLEYMPNKA